MTKSTSTILADIWCDILRLDHVEPSDDFFLLGGDSLDAMRVVMQAEEVGLTVDLQDLMNATTLRDLADEIDAKASYPGPSFDTKKHD